MKSIFKNKLVTFLLIVGLTFFAQNSFSQCLCPPPTTVINSTWTSNAYPGNPRTYTFSYTRCANGKVILNSLAVSAPGNASPYIENGISMVVGEIIRQIGDPGEICFPATCFKVINNKKVVIENVPMYQSEYVWCDNGCCCVLTNSIMTGEYDMHNGEQCVSGCQTLCP